MLYIAAGTQSYPFVFLTNFIFLLRHEATVGPLHVTHADSEADLVRFVDNFLGDNAGTLKVPAFSVAEGTVFVTNHWLPLYVYDGSHASDHLYKVFLQLHDFEDVLVCHG